MALLCATFHARAYFCVSSLKWWAKQPLKGGCLLLIVLRMPALLIFDCRACWPCSCCSRASIQALLPDVPEGDLDGLALDDWKSDTKRLGKVFAHAVNKAERAIKLQHVAMERVEYDVGGWLQFRK